MRSRLLRLRCARARLSPALAAAMSLVAVAGAAMAGPAASAAEEPLDPPHPLAARHPDRLVVVCEAGCPSHRGSEIVFTERVPQRRTAMQGMMVPTSTRVDDAPLVAASNVIECVAGCYDTPRFYKSPIIPTRPLGLNGTALMSTLPADTSPPKRRPFSPVRSAKPRVRP